MCPSLGDILSTPLIISLWLPRSSCMGQHFAVWAGSEDPTYCLTFFLRRESGFFSLRHHDSRDVNLYGGRFELMISNQMKDTCGVLPPPILLFNLFSETCESGFFSKTFFILFILFCKLYSLYLNVGLIGYELMCMHCPLITFNFIHFEGHPCASIEFI